MIPQLRHRLEDEVVGREIGRPHVGRVVPEDLHQRGLEQVHLRDDAGAIERREVGVRPAAGLEGLADAYPSILSALKTVELRGVHAEKCSPRATYV